MFIQNPEMPMQSQTELRRAAIDQELETRTHKAKDRRVQETGSDDGWQQIVFNNFFQRLPLSSLEAHSRRKGEENLEAMGIPWWNQSNRENYAGDTTGKSEKFFDKTPAQFYANADSVFNATVKAQGLNTEE